MNIDPLELATYHEWRRALRRLRDVQNHCSHVRYYCASVEKGIAADSLEKIEKIAQQDVTDALTRFRELVLQAQS